MFFFVKSEVPADKVEEFTTKVLNNEIPSVHGNVSYVTPDGRFGYDIIECRDENECRQQYSPLAQYGLKIDEIRQVEPMSEFLQSWKQKKQRAA